MAFLYRAWSSGSDLGYSDKTVLWIPLRAERIRIAPYSELIEKLDAMTSTEASIAKGYIDEFFTLQELNLLEECIQRSGRTSLFRRQYAAPLVCRDFSNGSVFEPARCRELRSINRTDNPCTGKISLLPYDVAGYLLDDGQLSEILRSRRS